MCVRRIVLKNIKNFFASEDKFARHSGIELLDVGTGWAKACMKVEAYHLNGAKTVHGGAIFTLADFVFAVASNSYGNLAMGINTSVSFVKSANTGTLYAEATEKALNPKLATYLVEVTDEKQNLVAIFQGTVYRKNESIIPADFEA
jgi:acyl-CoA thioesterase